MARPPRDLHQLTLTPKLPCKLATHAAGTAATGQAADIATLVARLDRIESMIDGLEPRRQSDAEFWAEHQDKIVAALVDGIARILAERKAAGPETHEDERVLFGPDRGGVETAPKYPRAVQVLVR